MSKEEIYEVGDIIETVKGKGKIIFRDRVSPESPIITLEGEWVYMIEDDNGKMIGPIKWYEINQIDKVVLDKPNGKTQSERLRNVLYIYCKQKIGKEPTKEQFAEFYQKYTEKYIQYIKDQLN